MGGELTAEAGAIEGAVLDEKTQEQVPSIAMAMVPFGLAGIKLPLPG